MKKTILSLVALALLFAACSKDDKNDNPEEHNWQISRIMMDHDTLRFTYNTDGTVHKLYDFGMDGTYRYSDSVQITWEGGRIAALNVFENGVLRPDAALIYNGDQVVRVQYYKEAPDGYIPGGYDSIKYVNGKMSEIHYINNEGVRTQYHKLTWTGENVTKDEYFAYNFDGTGVLKPMDETTYTYSNKPGLGKLVAGNVLFWFGDMELTHLGANLVTSSTTVSKVTEEEQWSSDYTYVFGANGLLESSKETETDVESNEKSEYNAKFEYLDLK